MCQGQAWEATALGALSGKPLEATQEAVITHQHSINNPRTKMMTFRNKVTGLVSRNFPLRKRMRGLLSDCGIGREGGVYFSKACIAVLQPRLSSSFPSTFLRCFQSLPKGHFSNNLPANPIATQDMLFFLKEVPPASRQGPWYSANLGEPG